MTRTGWEQASVGDVGTYINGLAFKPTDWESTGRPIIRIQNLTNKDRPYNLTNRPVDERYVVKRGDILVSWSATLDAFLWPGEDAVLNQHIFKVVPDRSKVTEGFLYYQLKLVIDEMWRGEHTHGSTMKHINRGPFLAHPFWVAPLDVQSELVAAIETHFSRLDAAVASLTRAKAKVASARASVLKAAVEGRLVPTEAELARAAGREYEPASELLQRILGQRVQAWNDQGKKGKYQEPRTDTAATLPILPTGWIWCTVDAVAIVSGGITKNSGRRKSDLSLPYLRVANVYADELRLDQVLTIPASSRELDRLRLKSGDLLIVEGNGSADQLGRVAIWQGAIDPCIHQNHLIKARPVLDGSSRWMLHWLLSPLGRTAIQSTASSTSGLHTLSISKVQALPVPLPPLAEQQRIVAEVDRRLSVLDALGASLDANLARCARLRQAILKRAFEGRLVPPAAALAS